jgi:hypothetical protein
MMEEYKVRDYDSLYMSDLTLKATWAENSEGYSVDPLVLSEDSEQSSKKSLRDLIKE